MASFMGHSATVSYRTADGEWRELGTTVEWQLENNSQEVVVDYLPSIVGETFTVRGTFTPSPEFWGIIVGMQLQYGLRDLHRNLGRYCQWPYTN